MMKSLFRSCLVLLMLVACEDVVEIETPVDTPRLYIDALIRIDESTPVTTAIVETGLTSSFFEDTEAAKIDMITIQNLEYQSSDPAEENFLMLMQTSPGRYEGSKNTAFFTTGELQLFIQYQGESYAATTKYVPAVPIDKLVQGEGSLFTGEETEIMVAFTDQADRNDFYLFDFDFNEYLVTEDEFYQGQTFEFSYFYEDGLSAGSTIDISIIGVDEAFYNYMNQLIVQSGGDQGPFQTPAATVRGNIINVTDTATIGQDNYALGYFAVCQVFSESITLD